MDHSSRRKPRVRTGTDPFGAVCPSTNSTAQQFFNYFSTSGSRWAGGGSHPATAGHFSFDIGGWHIIALNANCANKGVGGCGASSPQTTWLANDLATTTQPCILAYWHQPRWTGTSSNNSSTAAWWNLLYQAHADLVLNGHIHNYQRFAQLNANGQADPNGIREVIVGTGGESVSGWASNPTPEAIRSPSPVRVPAARPSPLELRRLLHRIGRHHQGQLLRHLPLEGDRAQKA